MLTQARLRELLHYAPDTGVFTWKETRGRRTRGAAAGSPHGTGYVKISVDGYKMFAHRLAFLYVTGSLPKNDVDHINGDKADNRWCNLRPATRQQNMFNTSSRGYSFCKRTGKWEAYLKLNYKKISLGRFATEDEAYSAYRSAAETLHGEFFRA